MRMLYEQIHKRIREIDFSKLWEGFHPFSFALYTREQVVFSDYCIPWNTCFIGNTAIWYENQYLAIWEITEGDKKEEVDFDLLAASIVHEMFHAYQNEKKEFRYPKDLLFLLEIKQESYYLDRFYETILLSEAFRKKEREDILSLLLEFCERRIQRERAYPQEVGNEYCAETIEGMAEYVGILALEQLAKEKAEEKLSFYYHKVNEISHYQTDIRRSAYLTGTLLLYLAKQLNLRISHQIGEESQCVYFLINQAIKEQVEENTKKENADEKLNGQKMLQASFKNCEERKRNQLKEVIRNVWKNKKEKIEEFYALEVEKTEGEFFISGFDPMNMLRVEDWVLCSNFVRLTEREGDKIISFMGKTLLQMKQESVNEVVAYFRKKDS